MPAEGRLHRLLAVLTLFHLGDSLCERRNHHAWGEPAQIATIGCGAIAGFRLSQFGEATPFLELNNDFLSLIFRIHEDMTGFVFLALHRRDGRFILFLDGLFAGGVFAQHPPYHSTGQQAALDHFQLLLDLGIVFQFLFMGLLNEQLFHDQLIH